MNQDNSKAKRAHSQLRAIHAALFHVLSRTSPAHPADQVLTGYLRHHREYGSRDRRLIGAVVFGVFRWWGWLNRLAPASLSVRFNALSHPADATAPEDVDEESATEWGRFFLAALLLEDMGAAPLALALLEECSLPGDAWQALVEKDDAADRFAGCLALFGEEAAEAIAWESLLPEWVADAIDCPRPTAELVQHLQSRPPVWLRTQKGETADLLEDLAGRNIQGDVHPRMTDAVSLGHQRVNLQSVPFYRRGRVEVQDIASQVVALVCAPSAGQHWWDACAGGGGKSLHLARLLKQAGGGEILATDVRPARLRELRRRADNTHARGILIRRWNGEDCPLEDVAFDGVLVDAPCSGSGTWARNPWSRWLTPAKDVASQAKRQLEILERVVARVAPGGVLVYATCSFFARENRNVCDPFLAAHDEMTMEPFDSPLTGEPTDGALQIWPWDANGNGMFVARFRKRAEAEETH